MFIFTNFFSSQDIHILKKKKKKSEFRIQHNLFKITAKTLSITGRLEIFQTEKQVPWNKQTNKQSNKNKKN